MNPQTQGQDTSARTPAPAVIDPGTQMGVVSLAVADLERSVTYYRDALGFAVLERTDDTATLGAGGVPLLLLSEERGARPWPHDRQGYTGLYHFAILVPTRADLGRWLRHWLELRLPLPGQGDHLVSEALYLSDPDGNGIEIYRDRPRSEWLRVKGAIQMAADPVDIAGLLDDAERAGEPWAGMPAGTRLGHMHLQVGDIPAAQAFYVGVLGFEVMARMPSALFISAGGYHHHIGMNIWHSGGSGHAPSGFAGLRFYTIEMPSAEARAQVVDQVRAAGVEAVERDGAVVIQDPWQTTILLTVGAAGTGTVPALRAAAAATAGASS